MKTIITQTQHFVSDKELKLLLEAFEENSVRNHEEIKEEFNLIVSHEINEISKFLDNTIQKESFNEIFTKELTATSLQNDV